MSWETARVLIVDDHPLFQDALAAALAAVPREGQAGAAHVLRASGLRQALEVLAAKPVDLILLDLQLSDCQGLDGLTHLRVCAPNTPIVIVSATETPEAVAKARALGASGYAPKSLALADLQAALVTVLDGGAWFPPAIGATADAGEMVRRLQDLTPAQARVLAGLSTGLLNKQIAFEMGISEATVKAHLTAIFRKLGAGNRTQALIAYRAATTLEPSATL